MIYGIDYLGGAKYAKTVLNYHKPGVAAGFFANTFGDVWPLVRQLANGGRCPLIRIHAIWEDDHTYRPNKHNPIIIREIDKINAEAKANPDVVWQFSPFCEHMLSGTQLQRLMLLCLERVRNVTVVNSPWTGKYYFNENVVNECHNNKAPPKKGRYNFSFDGVPAVDADVEKYKTERANADVFFMWTSQCNGRKNPNDKTPRPERKAWLTGELSESLVALTKPKGNANLPKNWLWKSHADQHLVPPEPRALKPVLISPLKISKFKLVQDGKVLIESSNAQPFEDGRWRYYFPKFGYQIASAPVELVGDNKVFGKVNPGFRENDYRNK